MNRSLERVLPFNIETTGGAPLLALFEKWAFGLMPLEIYRARFSSQKFCTHITDTESAF